MGGIGGQIDSSSSGYELGQSIKKQIEASGSNT
jgi:hypothetical protein